MNTPTDSNNMNTQSNSKSIEYQQRYQFWSERAVNQFSFSNNLLLTISIAALGYFFKEGRREFRELSIWWPFSSQLDVDATFFSLGTICIGLSIASGLIASMARLYDFNLTRHITLIRKRVYDKHTKIFPDDIPAEKSILESFSDLLKSLFHFGKVKITQSECNVFNVDLQKKFLGLRAMTAGFGSLSWIIFSFQLLFFILGLLLYGFVML
jgi:hypothetical protein